MLNLFNKQPTSIASIDIGIASVRILETIYVNGSCQIIAFGRDALRPGVIEGATVKDVDAVASSIRRAIISGRISAKEAVIAVPDAAAITKMIQINAELNEHEIEELIAFEAEKYFPYPLDEISLDFHVKGISATNPKMQDVLVVGARTEIVNARVEAVQHAGIEVNTVDVASYAAARAAYAYIKMSLPALSISKSIALFHIGEQETHFYVLKNYDVLYTRDEEFGTKQLIDTIMHNYSIAHDAAEKMILDQTHPDDFEDVILRPFKESLLLQMRRTLQFYFSTDHHEQFEHILLVGTVLKIMSLAEFMSEKIKIATSCMNPLAGMIFRQDVNQQALDREAGDFLISAGLSLREQVSL